MSILLLFQAYEEPVVEPADSIDLGSIISVSGTINCAADLYFMDIDVEHSAEVFVEVFPNVIDILISANAAANVFFSEENSVSIDVLSSASVLIDFSWNPEFSIAVGSGASVSMTFLQDSSLRFLDIAVLSSARTDISFSEYKDILDPPAVVADYDLKYLEFIV